LRGSSPAQERFFGPAERLIYRACGINPGAQMNWKAYAGALLAFNLAGLAALLGLELLQGRLPLNPAGRGPVEFWLALNTAVSFVTNTNWQAYSGETAMSLLTQMLGLGVQNFLSAATGVAVMAAMARGLSPRGGVLGNFWADLTRVTVRVLLPLSLAAAFFLVWQGVPQTFSAGARAATLEGAAQTIPLGPVASQEAIKQLGTNGGGFYGANSAHPLENPTPLSNFAELLLILLLPGACVFAYGELAGGRSHARLLFRVMLVLWALSLAAALWAEYGSGAPMEGKETRFGVTNSVLWAVSTTAASNGSVNAMHSSLSPAAGGLALFNMMLGEVVFGGAGSGMYGLALFALLTVFLCGLMVGRTPEYLGKKVERREMQMVITGILAPGAAILIGAAITCALPSALASLSAKGPHGFTELLYAWTSAAANNGSAFAGLNADTAFYNIGLALAMAIGRFAVIIPCLAIAGSMAAKRPSPPSAGTLPLDTPTFGALLAGVVLIVGGLTFFPALALGPVAEQILMLKGVAF